MENDEVNLFSRARKLFTLCACLDGGAFLCVFLLHRAGSTGSGDSKTIWLIGLITLFFVAITAIVMPIVLRMRFMIQTAKNGIFSLSGYRQLILWTIVLPMCGAFAAAVAYYFTVPKLHLLTIMLFALYGVYSAIPADKKIRGEILYFRSRFS